MLDDLADGSKILVRKVGRGEPESEFARLAEAVWAHGPSTLLRVTEAGPDWVPEPARRVADRLIAGQVRRFAPVEQAWEVDLEPWMHLVDGAYALERGRGAEPPRRRRLPARRCPCRAACAGMSAGTGSTALSAYTRAVDPAGVRGDAVHVFSSWVWIPEDFAGTASSRRPATRGWAGAMPTCRGAAAGSASGPRGGCGPKRRASPSGSA